MKEISYKSEIIKLSQSLNKKELSLWRNLREIHSL